MIEPMPQELLSVVPLLDRKTFVLLLRTLLKRSGAQQPTPVNLIDQVQVYLYEWLTHLNFFKDSQIIRVLDRVQPMIVSQLGWMTEIRPHSSFLTVIIVDRRYITWTRQREWYDIDTAEFVPEMDYPGVTLITCDVYALVLQKQQWLKKLKGVKDAGHTDHKVGHVQTGAAQA